MTPKGKGHNKITPRIGVQPGFVRSNTILFPMTPSSFGQIILNYLGSSTALYTPDPRLKGFFVGFISSTTVAHNQVLAEGGFFVPFVASTTSVHAPTAAIETFTAPFISSVSTTYALTATNQTFTAPFKSSTTAIYALVINDQPALSPGFIASVSTVYTFPISQFAVGFISSLSAAYAPTAVNQRVAAGFIPTSTVTYALTAAFRTVILPFKASTTLTFAPTSLRNNQVTLGFKASTTTTSALVVGRSWPASFYTGPLLTGNVLPNTQAGVFLGNQSGGIGVTVTQARTAFAGRQTSAGRTLDIYHYHYDGSLSANFNGIVGCEDPTSTSGAAPGGITQEAYAIANGSYPMISWMPQYTVAQINAGTADAIFTKLATYWATYGTSKIVWRPWTEFNLPSVYGIYAGGGSPVVVPSDFRTAWRRVVNLVKAIAPNVCFCFNFDEGNNRDYIASCYPGDAYVDWVSSDAYNSCHVTAPSCFSTPLHSGFGEWWELFNYTHGTGLSTGSTACLGGAGVCRTWSNYDIFGAGVATRNSIVCVGGDLPADLPTQKPYFIAETGCIYDNTDVTTRTRKGLFWSRLLSDANGITAMPNCIGLTPYDADVHSADNYDWRVDSNASVVNVTGTSDPATLAAWAAMAGDSRLVGKA